MDVVGLVVVHGMEVIVAVDWVQGAVVGKLLLGDGRVVLKTKDGSDVVLTLDSGQFTPMVRTVRYRLKITENLALTYHSFLTRGFSQHSVLFEIALGVKGFEGAARAQEAEAKAQTVAEVKRILNSLMVQFGKKHGRALPIFIVFTFSRRPSANGACIVCVRPSRLRKTRDELKVVLSSKVWLRYRNRLRQE
jgi:hypothetical protein